MSGNRRSQIHTNASRRQRAAQPTRPTVVKTGTNRPRSTDKMIATLQLMHEALSRARMRRPQDHTSEAYRSARRIALNAHNEQTRLMGIQR
ncbi:hypothetical protein GCM10023322_23170 [Rugosimonospora acidiphila]|uniref:DUF2786 domain-containing protein n=1 Tax=Rugosimonospora acidiphila TaxID=556531 RepID=A0ABP9RQU1_9ACTN